MEVHDLPFNRFLGIKMSDRPELGLLQLDDLPQYENHLGTVHVCAQFALAEACGGYLLVTALGDRLAGCDAVMRRAETRLRKPAAGVLYARAPEAGEAVARAIDEMRQRGRSLLAVPVEVVDATGATTLGATFEWFLQRRTALAS